MFRLLRILIVATLLAGIYFYLQQTSFITTTWQRTQISTGISLAFPDSPRHHTRLVHNPNFGKTQLDIYDLIQPHEAYICLMIQPRDVNLQTRKLEEMLDAIRVLNDTAGVAISLKKQFVYRGYPAYEYHAGDGTGKALRVRLVKIDNAILSMIYAVNDHRINPRTAENFFASLKF